jgi:hypothetical protein
LSQEAKTMMTSRYGRRAGALVERRNSLLLFAGVFGGLVGFKKTATAAQTGPASSPTLADLKVFGPSYQVQAIEHRDESYRVTTADGRTAVFTETNLRFKVDSSFLGPRPGIPVLLPAGTMGDRAWVFFAAPGEIGSFIAEQGARRKG